MAPHFTLLGIDGREYRLPNSVVGEPALLVFFKSTCATCDLTFPYLNRLTEEYPTGWQMWAIAQDAPDAAREYARRQRIECPVLIDAPGYDVSRLYDPAATPTLFLLDQGSRTEFVTHGFAKDDLNEISRRIAFGVDVEAVTIAPLDDGRPPFKPG